MSNNFLAIPDNSNSLEQINIAQRAKEYAESSKSLNTRKAYKADWRHFSLWCEINNAVSLPADASTVAIYITLLAESFKTSTIARHLASIAEAHRVAGFDPPTENKQLQLVWKGIRRSKGIAKTEKTAILSEDLRSVLSNLPDNLHSIRDRALLLLGFVGAFRRSELVSLNRQDLSFSKDGIVVHVVRSKTDQEGIGTDKAIPYSSDPLLCPVRALLAWIEATLMIEEALFTSIGKGDKIHPARLSDKAVALIVKQRIEQSGKDSSGYSGHSLRSGFVTQAALNGANDRQIMAQTKHRSRAMIDRYVRVASIWKENAATSLGL